MSRQDKATTEKFSRTLRELVKRPENKTCADCKRNDPRWASWNLGVFLCIRCSGIHRGMGTHISKVKSVDLDVWTPEQMESITKWGNHLANLYWEAHLKAGHIPPEHKMESFIRSKYETRRWAMEGPPPTNPSVLDSGTASSSAPTVASPPQQTLTAVQPNRQTHNASSSVSSVNRQPQGHPLLSSTYNASRTQVAPPAKPATPPVQPQAPKPAEDIFSLDFHAPAATAATAEPKKDVKNDILSLFSSAPVAPNPGFNQQAAWTGALHVQPQQQSALPVAPTSMMGTNGVGMWGTSSGWAQPAAPAQPNIWNNTQPQTNLFDTNSVWGGTASTGAGASQDLFSTPTAPVQKKDDAFGDIWGGFK
ncbi:hypothetical protein CPB83DRAFT_601110 [Crepidotus variabilis]|uniref:Arf-GAP domain-containing protein n=1 Tax=Crepidotus variabilis TaxID=179855 RepID=A0A9P6E997_9AGAR|nr:hypothetical protein CPB83DRAFT_601110 [Crepidotus variabilis]